MLTLKFMSFFDDNEEVEDVVATPHYNVYTHRNGRKTVCTYTDHTKTGGVERTVMSDALAEKLATEYDLTPLPNYYHVCYVVDTQSGNTIDKIGTK